MVYYTPDYIPTDSIKHLCLGNVNHMPILSSCNGLTCLWYFWDKRVLEQAMLIRAAK